MEETLETKLNNIRERFEPEKELIAQMHSLVIQIDPQKAKELQKNNAGITEYKDVLKNAIDTQKIPENLSVAAKSLLQKVESYLAKHNDIKKTQENKKMNEHDKSQKNKKSKPNEKGEDRKIENKYTIKLYGLDAPYVAKENYVTKVHNNNGMSRGRSRCLLLL